MQCSKMSGRKGEAKQEVKSIPLRKFEIRECVLLEVFRGPNGKSVKNFVLGYFILLCVRNALNDLYYGGQSQFGFLMIKGAFENFGTTIWIWMFMFLVHLSIYFGWNYWAEYYTPKSIAWNWFWLSAGFFGLFGTFYIVCEWCQKYSMGIACRAIIIDEQVRFIMKGYAFLRSRTEEFFTKPISYIPSNLSHYLYFSFAPTLLYRNEYPKSPNPRDWNKIMNNIIEVFFFIYCLSLLEYEYFFRPLSNFGKKPFSATDLLYLWVSYSVPATMFTGIMAMYIGLNLVQEIFAELLEFGDREYIKDWWTVSSLPAFYQKWSYIIQCFLYENIYRDLYENITSRNKTLSAFGVFAVSILFHELILINVVNIACPVFIVSIFLSSPLLLPGPKKCFSNLLMLTSFLLGHSALFLIPHLEYFAIHNCPNTSTYYLPRLLTCYT